MILLQWHALINVTNVRCSPSFLLIRLQGGSAGLFHLFFRLLSHILGGRLVTVLVFLAGVSRAWSGETLRLSRLLISFLRLKESFAGRGDFIFRLLAQLRLCLVVAILIFFGFPRLSDFFLGKTLHQGFLLGLILRSRRWIDLRAEIECAFDFAENRILKRKFR